METVAGEDSRSRCRLCSGMLIPPGPAGSIRADYYSCRSCGLQTFARNSQPQEMVNDNLNQKSSLFLNFLMERRCRLILRMSDNPRPALLDVGCGSARFLAKFGRYGRVVGVEPSLASRAQARERLGLDVFERIEDIPTNMGPFDVICLWHVLEHVDQPVEFLTGLKHLLAPNGFLFISVPNAESLQARVAGSSWAYYDVAHHLFQFTPASLRSTLLKAGLQPDRFRAFSSEYGPFGWLQSLLNLGMGEPHNFFYLSMKRGQSFSHMSRAAQRSRLRMESIMALLLAGPSLGLALAESLFGRGGVLEVAATIA